MSLCYRRSHSSEGERGLPLVLSVPEGKHAQRELQHGRQRRGVPRRHRCDPQAHPFCLRLPVRPSACPSGRLPACLPVCLSVCLFLCAFGVSLSLRAKRAGCVCARAADPQPPGRLGVLGQKLRATYPWSSPNPWVTSRESCLLGSLPVASGEEVEPAVDPVTGCEVDNLACEPVYFATAWLSSCVASAKPDHLPTCLDMHRPRREQDEQSV